VIGKTGKPLGFVNPLLYQMWGDQPSAFIDITSGDNACTEQGCNCAPGAGGFTAAAGWDPVTGLGSPNFNVMQSYIHSHFAKIAKQ
jgi:tripeptidyl-peptidase-1